VSVPVERLDAIIDKIVPSGRFFLKMDTQGYDLKVMKGAAGCLDRICMLQSEVAMKPLYEGAPAYRESLEALEKLGFAVSAIFNLHRDEHLRLGEFDCIMVREPSA
jgi:Methyltransferase FkbM domain